MMRLGWLNTFLFLLVMVCLIIGFAARRDFRFPNAEFLPDMAHSPAYAAQSTNPNFRDGITSRAPAPGAIARELRPLEYHPTPQDALRAGRELRSPLKGGDPAAVQRGSVVFARMCQHCHGAGGLGDGPVVKRGFPPPPSLLAEHAIAMKDGQMFHIITYGQGNMPPHAAQVDTDNRWDVIAYIRSLESQSTQPQQAPQPQPASRLAMPRGGIP